MMQVKLSHKQAIKRIRDAHKKRAEYMYFIFQDMAGEIGKENAEKIIRRALKRAGHHYGSKMNLERTPSGLIEFLEKSSHKDTFDRKVKERNDDRCIFTLGYCPLVAAWKEFDLDAREIGLLCNIAMETDFGMMEELGLHLDLTKSLGSGDNCCEMIISGSKR
jgi:predicted ArsR family transcriptional regulator